MPDEHLQAHCPVDFHAESHRLTWAAGSQLVVVDWKTKTIMPHEKSPVHSDTIRAIGFSPNGDRIVTAGEDKYVVVWEVVRDQDSTRVVPIRKFLHAKKIMVAVFDHENRIIFGDKFGEFHTFTTSDGLPPIGTNVDQADGQSSSDEETDNASVRHCFGHLSAATVGVISRKRNLFASGDRDEKLRLARYPRTDIIESFLLGHRRYVSQLVWADAAHLRLVSAGADGHVVLWDVSDVASPKKIWTVSVEGKTASGKECLINSVAVGGDNVYVVRSDRANEIIVLSVATGSEKEIISCAHPIQSLFVDPADTTAVYYIDEHSHLRSATSETAIKLPANVPGVPIAYIKSVHHENS